MQKQRLAERAAEAMLGRDPATAWFGITLDAVGPGYGRIAAEHGLCGALGQALFLHYRNPPKCRMP
ncbi:MAG: hypothetical protein AAFY19_13520 [Pseudomonadota bacterium]